MKVLKIVAIVFVAYVGLVVAFESLIGVFQPEADTTLVITTTGADGDSHDRVVSGLDVDGKLYVAANHWPRAWYEQALAHPEVSVLRNGERTEHVAVPVSGAEHDRVNTERALGPFFRFLTGFPPRYFLRLDPLPAAGSAS